MTYQDLAKEHWEKRPINNGDTVDFVKSWFLAFATWLDGQDKPFGIYDESPAKDDCCDKCGDFDEYGQHAHHVHCQPRKEDKQYCGRDFAEPYPATGWGTCNKNNPCPRCKKDKPQQERDPLEKQHKKWMKEQEKPTEKPVEIEELEIPDGSQLGQMVGECVRKLNEIIRYLKNR